MTPTNPNTESIKTALRYVVTIAVVWLIDHGYLPTADAYTLVTAIMVLAPAAWAIAENYFNAHKTKAVVAEAVNAGIQAGAADPGLANTTLTTQDAHALVVASTAATPK